MSTQTIDLPESLTIHRIEEIFGDLKIAFGSDAAEYKINAEGVDTIDTSGLQVLLRLILTATQNGKSISWLAPSDTLVESAKQVGLDKQLLLS